MSNCVLLLEIRNNFRYPRIGKVIVVIYPSIDKLLNVVDSKYKLVHIAARRSKEMTKTEFYQLPINKYVSKKNIGRALEEVAEGMITVRPTK